MPDVWPDIPALPHNAKEKVDHPTQKPIKLMERIVSLFTKLNQERYNIFSVVYELVFNIYY